MPEQTKTTKVLGVADYDARWIAKTAMVRLTATGILPCANYQAQLEMRPERVLPPMWNMVFFQEEVCLKALKPFSVDVVMINSVGARSISVTDATGEHSVPVKSQFESMDTEVTLKALLGEDEYVVYAKLPKSGDTHHGCIVVPVDTMVTAIHYRAFGPASKSDCEAFVNESCSVFAPMEAASVPGDEIPWPWPVLEE